MNWHKWHEAYETSPTLQARLRLVRDQLTKALETASHPNIRLVSVCAGDGRDVIGTLVHHPRRLDVSAYLVEIDPALVARGNAALEEYRLTSQAQFLQADATLAEIYKDIAPVAVLVVSRVFGNIRDSALELMIRNLACLCHSKAALVWTRSVGQASGQQAVKTIRALLEQTGFTETSIEETNPTGFVVATHTYEGTPCSRFPEGKLFEFTGYDQISAS